MRRNLVVCLVAILIVLGSFLNFVEVYDIGTSEPESITSQSGGSRGTDKKITINNNSDFASMAITKNWSGNGTQGNPYMIENLTIDGKGGWHCIYIGNTTVHFIIRNCTLTNATKENWPYEPGYGIKLYKIKNGKILSNNLTNNIVEIYVYWSDNIDIENNSCIGNGTLSRGDGINILYSNYIGIRNNICINNFGGISALSSCKYLTIENNICNSNQNIGFASVRLGSSYIGNNSCNNNNLMGMHLAGPGVSNILINNTGNSNSWYGLDLQTTSCVVKNNTFSNNGRDGIRLWAADSSIVDNNICSENRNGIYSHLSDNVIFSNNSCINNSNSGIYLNWSHSNRIKYNFCTLNKFAGLHIEESHNSIVSKNNITKNQNGIYVNDDSNGNIVIENLISYNTNMGIRMGKDNLDCSVYHNNMISNFIQAFSIYPNSWDNGQGEGNHWNDYTGLDDGSNGRTAGDGIGDTKLPHPDELIDIFPFMNYSGWLEPLSQPSIYDPGKFDFDGNYVLNWSYYPRANNYILQEDTSSSFNSPVTLYDGKQLFYNINGKDNGTYYYRIRAYSILEQTDWSNIEYITVDMIPSTPTGLVIDNVKGHEINLSWNPNPEQDIAGYHILMNDSGTGNNGPFHHVKTVMSTTTQIEIFNLVEETTYHFVISAFDDILSNSTFSEVVLATTLDETPPDKPTGLKAKAISGSTILLNWNSNTDFDLAGYAISMNDTGAGLSGPFQVIIATGRTVTSTLVEDLAEETTYYFAISAFDEVPNNSSYSSIAFTTTPDETPPAAPTGLTIVKSTYDSLVLNWESNSEEDIVGYFLFRTNSSNDHFIELNSEPLIKTTYFDTDLEELTTYYYKLRAMDDAEWNSPFSEQVIGKTLEKEKAPIVKNEIPDIELQEDSMDDSIDLHSTFSDPNSDSLTFRCIGQEYIEVTIDSETSMVVLLPEPDWSGEEILTFYASDGISEASQSITVIVTQINDPPGPAQILDPEDGLEINEETGIAFFGSCTDPDLPYGDELIYRWISNIDGALGLGKSLNNIILSSGEHKITLEATDNSGLNSSTEISVNVVEKTIKKETDKGEDLTPIIAVIIVLLIVFLILVFMLFNKGKPNIVNS